MRVVVEAATPLAWRRCAVQNISLGFLAVSLDFVSEER